MSEQSQPDDVEGHRLLTPNQAQDRAEAARRERQQRLDEAGDSTNDD
jgi:hypothetical protein